MNADENARPVPKEGKPPKRRRLIGPRGLGFKLFVVLALLLFLYFFINTLVFLSSFTKQMESKVLHHAIQVSDLVKRSTRYSMHKNHREDLANIIDNIGREEGIEGVWIYNKAGEIRFSSHPSDLNHMLDKEAEQCVFCHQGGQAKGTIPVENRYRFLRAEDGSRVLGMINPIENEPSCANASCHAHPADEKLLGLLDIQMSLKDTDEGVAETRRKVILVSCGLVFLAAVLFWGLVHWFVQRPVTKLIEGTRAVAGMNLDTTIDLRSRDEFGDLAASFNRMTWELKRANLKLQEWSNTLEEKVRQKTAALEKAQSHLILAEKMASLGQLAAMVAHEINNPLAGILTYSKLSIRYLETEADAARIGEALENLGVIRDEARRCGDIVKNLLLFSRKTGSASAPCELNAVVERSVDLTRHSFEVKGVELAMELEEGELHIHCNQDGIQQVLLGLLINALEAVTDPPGRVTVRTQCLPAEKKVRIVVADTGGGIPEDVLPHIFEPFFTTKEKGKGTGLGLAVVYGTIERHGGSISVRSEPGEGTEFTIDLPEKPDGRNGPETPDVRWAVVRERAARGDHG